MDLGATHSPERLFEFFTLKLWLDCLVLRVGIKRKQKKNVLQHVNISYILYYILNFYIHRITMLQSYSSINQIHKIKKINKWINPTMETHSCGSDTLRTRDLHKYILNERITMWEQGMALYLPSAAFGYNSWTDSALQAPWQQRAGKVRPETLTETKYVVLKR